MTTVTTTQEFFPNHQMVSGSLSMLTVTLVRDGHKYWDGTAVASADVTLTAGVEYTITDIGGAGGPTLESWKNIGFKPRVLDNGTEVDAKVGDKFIAMTYDANGNPNKIFGDDIAMTAALFGAGATDAAVKYDNTKQSVAHIVNSLQERISIIYLGVANAKDKDGNTVSGAPADGMRIMAENAGYQNADGIENRDGASGTASELLRALNERYNTDNGLKVGDSGFVAEGDTTVWNVQQFTF